MNPIDQPQTATDWRSVKIHTELLQIIGEPRGEFIAFGRYGNARLYSNGFVMVDPCYIFDNEDNSWSDFLGAWWKLKPEGEDLNHWLATDFNEWKPVEFRGHTVHVRNTGGDGTSRWGLSTDSGTNAAIPYDLLPQRIKDMINVVETEEVKP